MCGILGITGCASTDLSAPVVARALSTMRHRGPNDEGYLFHSARGPRYVAAVGTDTNPEVQLRANVREIAQPFDVAFAHRRLSIIDVSVAGHQPMVSRDERYALLLNGEIYNFVELREQLTKAGHAFHTASDTEVLLAAYSEWGSDMLPRLVGMFAFAILDLNNGSVLVARDPFGIKPLFWTRVGKAVAFASAITPLLALRKGPVEADTDALFRYMRFGVTDGGATTMFAGIHQLPPAHYMSIASDGCFIDQPRAYWRPGQASRRRISMQEAAGELRRLLDDSVRFHLRSDVPLGTCLSGGLDSTAIVALMRAQLGTAAPIHSFSFESDDPRSGEGKYVAQAVAAFGLNPHRVQPTPAELLEDFETLVRAQEQPFSSSSVYAQFRVFRMAREAGMVVMLDGQGADELFGGYSSAVSAQIASALLRGRLKSAVSLSRTAHVSAPGARRRMILAGAARLLPAKATGIFLRAVGEQTYPSWLSEKWFGERGHRAEDRVWGRGRHALVEELIHATTSLTLPQLLRYEDRNSMAFSIESRVPFCTTAIADFALSLPTDLLISRHGETKAVLRQAVEGLIPSEIIRRPKIGFETPEANWLKAMEPWVRKSMESDRFRRLPFMRQHALANLANSGFADGGARPQVWRALNVAAWAEQFGVSFDSP